MKTKTIKKILQSKVADLVESISDPEIAILVSKGTIITGGCIASMLLKEEVNDFDIYFRDLETTLRVAQYYVAKFKELNTYQVKGLSDKISSLHVTEEDGRVKVYLKSVGLIAEDR